MVTVTKNNFIEESNSLLEHLPTAAFVAIDEEMTGICLPNTRRPPKDHNPSQRYEFLKPVPERYTIIQLGICLFHRNPNYFVSNEQQQQEHATAASGNNSNTNTDGAGEPEYLVRQYNFYLFPPADNSITREVVLNPSSVAFLNQHNMDFDLWSKQGIPFVTGDVAKKVLAQYRQKQEEKKTQSSCSMSTFLGSPKNTNNSNIRANCSNAMNNHLRRVELRRAEDIDFHARAMASLREWLDAANAQIPSHHHHLSAHHHPHSLSLAHHAAHHPDATTATTTANTQHHVADGVFPAEAEVGGVSYSTAASAAAIPDPTPEGVSFLLPPCNSFLRRALYESIQAEYPSLILEHAVPSNMNQIRVWRLNPEEKRRREERLLREGWEDLIINQIGMWRVFAALSLACRGLPIATDSIEFAPCVGQVNWKKADNTYHGEKESSSRRRIPLIVHNGYMDLMFLLTHFHSHQLPDTYWEAKTTILHYFPVIYDTKVLSTECAPSPLWTDCSHLENLFIKVVRENEEFCNQIQVISSDHHNAIDRGIHSDDHPEDHLDGNMHEAAYDAYMTGSVFVGLCRYMMTREHYYSDDHLPMINDLTDGENSNFGDLYQNLPSLLASEDDEDVKYFFGRNLLYLMLTMYTIDLENPAGDPLSRGMLPDTTFRVSGFDSSVTTRDIVRCLSGLFDSNRRKVNFEIVWVDDTTVLVAVCYKQPGWGCAGAPSQSSTLTMATTGTGSSANTNASPHQSRRHKKIDEMEAVVHEHGRLVLEALKNRFPTEPIVRLDEHLRALEDARNKKLQTNNSGKWKSSSGDDSDNGWTSRFSSFLGRFFFGTSSSQLDDDDNCDDDDDDSGKKREAKSKLSDSTKRRRLG